MPISGLRVAVIRPPPNSPIGGPEPQPCEPAWLPQHRPGRTAPILLEVTDDLGSRSRVLPAPRQGREVVREGPRGSLEPFANERLQKHRRRLPCFRRLRAKRLFELLWNVDGDLHFAPASSALK